MKAVVVDDEPVMLRSFLRESKDIPDLEIMETFNSSWGIIDYLQNNIVDVLFLDIEMPDIEGKDLAIKCIDIQPNIVIVFVTGHEYSWCIKQIGPDYEYLMKPYDRQNLLKVMQNIKINQNDHGMNDK